MDPLTHGLATFALKRGLFPKVPRPVVMCMLLAGTLADLDWLSGVLGASAFLTWSGGALHSLAGTIVLSLAICLAIRSFARKRGVLLTGFSWWFAPLCAGLLHVAMDALQSTGVQLLWPFNPSRIALDWMPSFDIWTLILLSCGILLPELFRLVSDEIGAKSKKPKGRTGAIAVLVLLTVYASLRGTMHSNALAMLMERSYAGESARRAGAFPDSASPFLWHGVVETESAMHLLQVPTGPMRSFDPENAIHIHKPEPSPILDAAQKTEAARQFLTSARFPKATVQRETEGYSVELRDLKNDALGQTARAVEVEINLDPAAKVTFAHLEWLGQKRKN